MPHSYTAGAVPTQDGRQKGAPTELVILRSPDPIGATKDLCSCGFPQADANCREPSLL
ncbi:hypothetical protein SBA2_520003 [Acidobacteriia bacterium SbA2]|nr:hypothetical protein SBA2_520003 [Acidobacteriia bacterium SbA2]